MARSTGSSGIMASPQFGAADDVLIDAMSAGLAPNWGLIALRGVLAILLGSVAIVLPGVALASLVLLIAAYMLADGVLAIVAGIRATRRAERWGLLILDGVADVLAGGIALFWPLATVLFVVLLMSAWAIASGMALVLSSFRLHVDHGRWLMLLSGIVSVLWGILLVLRPVLGALALTWWMGGYALLFGGALIALAFRLRWNLRLSPRGPVGSPA